MDAVQKCIEHIDFKDEPLLNPKIKKDVLERTDFDNIYSMGQKENFELLREFRLYLDEINGDREGYEK